MLRTFMEIVSTYNRSMYKNRHIKRANNKINIFYIRNCFIRKRVPDTSKTKIP